MTTRIQITSFGPEPVAVVVQGREDGQFTAGVRTILYPEQADTFHVHSHQTIKVVEANELDKAD